MCGIGGLSRMGGRAIDEIQIDSLLLGLEHRGRDASGIVIVNDGDANIYTHKSALKASNFLDSSRYKEFIKEYLKDETKIVLVHTRAWTKGRPSENSNNHPLFNGLSAVVHNGWVHNDDELFESTGYERHAEVDSDIIRAIVDEEGLTRKCVRELGKLSGAVASAIVDKRKPGEVLLLRSGNPLCYGVSKDFVIWASTKDAVSHAFKQWQKMHGIWAKRARRDVFYGEVPVETAWLLGKTKLEWHQEFKTAPYTSNSRGWQDWHNYDPRQSWEKDLEDMDKATSKDKKKHKTLSDIPMLVRSMFCPNNKCGKRLVCSDDDYKTPKSKLFCVHCNACLANAKEMWVPKKDSLRL